MSTIYGSDNPTVKDKLNGTYFDDYIYAYAGNDQVKASFGDDYVDGGAGNDILYGGYGDDRMEGGAGGDKLRGETGDDDLVGGAGRDLLDGGSGDDTLDVGDAVEMKGDTVDGDSGIDRLYADYSNAKGRLVFAALDHLDVYAAPGFSVTNVEQYWIDGTSVADEITGWRHDDRLRGQEGNDVLNGGAGRDSLEGGYGADQLMGGAGDDSIYGDDYGSVGKDTISGGAGDDWLRGGDGADRMTGDNGDDVVYGDEGTDTLTGGAGDDDLYGGKQSDTLNGGDGDDFLASDFYNFTVENADTGTEKDGLVCGDGNDSAAIGVGDDANGGAGFDAIRLSFGASATAVSFTLTSGALSLQNGTTFTGFEVLEFQGGSGKDKVTGGDFDDTLNGGAGDDQLTGGKGDDDLDGEDGNDVISAGDGDDSISDTGAGNDRISCGAGNDTVWGGMGQDSILGEAGDDVFRMSDDFQGDAVNGGAGFDTVDFYPSFTSVYIDLERQVLNDGAALDDTFKGVELFVGSYVDDVFLGDAATNWLQGGSGGDTLNGRGGDDWLDGQSGSDVMTGGAGADTFVLHNGDDFLGTTWPADIITDFVHGQDVLQISLYDFGYSVPGDLKIVNGADPQPASGAPTFLFETDTHRLWFDDDGTGDAKDPYLIATLDGVNQLVASDFDFVS
jgi:Ca2+-binding RTX toxin-like protein